MLFFTQMKGSHRIFKAALVLLALIGMAAVSGTRASAQTPLRETNIVVSYTEHQWWLLSWTNNTILCSIFVDHEGLPTSKEVYNACGASLQAQWLNTQPCQKILKGNFNTETCDGLYLHKVTSQPKTKEISISLPPIEVWVTLEGCDPTPLENRCIQLPKLLLTGEEPLPNERITAIEGLYNNQPFACEGATCAIPLRVTPRDGIQVEFKAKSSFGDESRSFRAQVRVIESGVSQVPYGSGWFVDVLSTQWQGARLASCSQTWEAFPPIGGLTGWLSTPDQSQLLSSNQPYYYLAGRLIARGIVDASACSTGGLQLNGYADACGLETAKPVLESWQNQFDNRIIEVAKQTGVPATLMKNLFAQESQFWPGMFRVPNEFGLGQITDNGADTILQWNPSFYDQICPLVLSQDTCKSGYLHLEEDEQEMLRGALAVQAKADCPGCQLGIDLTNVDFSLSLFAKTLLANCEQVAQIVYNASGKIAGTVSSYEDLWRLTVANYHTDPGCLSYAVHMAWNTNTNRILWDEVSTQFTVPCKGVVPYVEKISLQSTP
ncbi:MAG: hypothetical protein JSV61_08150 [Anaerolineales bacterium]|nr:MAG: hypothetical protein JSV61_08150 [Anaerolineales bacterium]